MSGFLPQAGTITGRTRVAGVFGDPVAHSLSPPMHNAAFAELGLDGVYVPFHVRPQHLAAAVAGVRALGLVGVNVTIPHKVTILPLLDEVAKSARLIGAVNTVVNRDGRLEGHNTDGQGFVRSMRAASDVEPADRRVLILGAGGAAQAIAVQMALEGAAEVAVANRTYAKAVSLAEAVSGIAAATTAYALTALTPAVTERYNIVVHTTSWGMAPSDRVPPLLPPELLHPHHLVCDIVYTPQETSLLRAARERGCAVLEGLGMLVHQAALAFELWTEAQAPAYLMERVLREELAKRTNG